MSLTTGNNGRLCNQIIRNLAVHFLAKKHDLYVEYYNHELITKIGIELFVGQKKFPNTIILNNENYFSLLNSEQLLDNVDPMSDYFQTDEITKMICQYFLEIKENIKNKNRFSIRYNCNNDVFIHIRLTDASQHNPGLNYYLYCLSKISFDQIYISTDDYEHHYIKNIISNYPSTRLLYMNEIDTIHFGSTCKHVILSHGSFSAVIGYLSFYSDIYYLNINTTWCPIELFKNKGWISIEEKDINF